MISARKWQWNDLLPLLQCLATWLCCPAGDREECKCTWTCGHTGLQLLNLNCMTNTANLFTLASAAHIASCF